MPQSTYKISEARKNFAEVLERANQGEEIIIMRGNQVYARIGPADTGGRRPFGSCVTAICPTISSTKSMTRKLQSMPAISVTISAYGKAIRTTVAGRNETSAR